MASSWTCPPPPPRPRLFSHLFFLRNLRLINFHPPRIYLLFVCLVRLLAALLSNLFWWPRQLSKVLHTTPFQRLQSTHPERFRIRIQFQLSCHYGNSARKTRSCWKWKEKKKTAWMDIIIISCGIIACLSNANWLIGLTIQAKRNGFAPKKCNIFKILHKNLCIVNAFCSINRYTHLWHA